MEGIKEIQKADALNEILALAQQANQMGRQDFEPSAFKNIAKKLTDGDIEPGQAVEEARALLDSKQMG